MPSGHHLRPTIDSSDVLPLEVHERMRGWWGPMLRREKRARRVELGHLCLLFETRATVLWQIQEILRVEARSSAAHIQREIDEYTCLVPQPGQLTATLTIHSGSAEVGAVLSSEIDRGLLTLEMGTWRCPCRRLRSGDEGPAAVHYVGFAIPEPAIEAMRATTAWLRVESAIERRRVALTPATRASLLETLAGEGDRGAQTRSLSSHPSQLVPARLGPAQLAPPQAPPQTTWPSS